jgi:hypothetical protein
MKSEEQDKERRKALMLRAVQDQLDSPETPEVKQHYQRLLSLGHSENEAKELIATILAFYIWHTARKDGYTYADYLAALAKLPEIDWETGEGDE